MGTVELQFSPLPSHVRTARMVAAAIARRSGVDDAVLDEVRLAVGEACSRAVGLHQEKRRTEPVVVAITAEYDRFSVEVSDRLPSDAAVSVGSAVAGAASVVSLADMGLDDLLVEALPGSMALAVLSGLVEDVDVRPGPHGTVIRMSWPIADAELYEL